MQIINNDATKNTTNKSEHEMCPHCYGKMISYYSPVKVSICNICSFEAEIKTAPKQSGGMDMSVTNDIEQLKLADKAAGKDLKPVLAGHDLSGFTQEQIDKIEKILISTINDCSEFIVSRFDFCGEEILIAEALSEFYQTDWSFDDDRICSFEAEIVIVPKNIKGE